MVNGGVFLGLDGLGNLGWRGKIPGKRKPATQVNESRAIETFKNGSSGGGFYRRNKLVRGCVYRGRWLK